MSRPLISRSPDLSRLRDEGYAVDVKGGYVMLRDVPYVTSAREVRRGVLAAPLSLVGDVAARPADHRAYFVGEFPCDAHGAPLERIRLGAVADDLGDGEIARHSFSSKPAIGYYVDHHEQLTSYAAIIANEAAAIDPDATARTFRVIEGDGVASPFNYVDTATSRAGIGSANRRLALGAVGIVGLGGTGAYVLDLVAKTPVRVIRLYDPDELGQHNAFRAPGAPGIEELRARPLKVDHYAAAYGRMRRGVEPHPVAIDAANVGLLSDLDFVFVCVDAASARRAIVDGLEAGGVPFVDVGMGAEMIGDAILATLRITTSTVSKRDHVHAGRVPLADAGAGADVYARNIQIADLNALNASLAVVRWKRHFGFYHDSGGLEHFCAYATDGNQLLSEDRT